MPKEYSTDQFWKLYKKLPKDLQEAIFSVENADSIYDICEKNDINDISGLAKITGNVLLGLLSPNEFKESLIKDMGLSLEKTQKVFREINSFIFYPVKKSLDELYGIDLELHEEKLGETLSTTKKSKKKTSYSGKKDVYREKVAGEE